MALINRQTLKNYFKKGGLITEKHFYDLIDSSLNVVDDGVTIKPEHGLKLNPLSYSTRLMSFFKKSTQKEPEFTIDLNKDQVEGLSIQSYDDKTLLKFKREGQIGIQTNNPKYDFEVNGTLGFDTKVGTYKIGSVPGDRNWHTIIGNLDGVNGFEVTANIKGTPGKGMYCLSHVIALSTFGGIRSQSKIKATTAFYGDFRNKIRFRWTGDMHNYALQVKTARHYGIDPKNGETYRIKYNIIRLFSDP